MGNATTHYWVSLARRGLCASLLLAGAGTAQTPFTDVSDQALPFAVTEPGAVRSQTAGDYDNDGWPDLFFSEGKRTGKYMHLLHNEADGRFAERTEVIRTDRTARNVGGGAIFADYDNDGDLDLFVPVGNFGTDRAAVNILLRNDRGTLVDVTLEAGLTDELPTDNAIWLDYDRDGYLDLYTGNLSCATPTRSVLDLTARNRLYRNQGDGTFADRTVEAGLDVPLVEPSESITCAGGSNGGILAGDFNNDGWPDLFIGVFLNPNRLFLNDGTGRFVDATTGEIASPGEAWSAAMGDIDNDGDLDINQIASGGGRIERSTILLNEGDALFLDVTEGVGLRDIAEGAGSHSILEDLDNDGDVDVVIDGARFYANNGDLTFSLATEATGHFFSHNLVDYNLDGFPDLWAEGLWRNEGNDNHWLRIELAGVQSNRNGIGARLLTTAGDLRQMREMSGGKGRQQNEMVAHFGLGSRTQVDSLEIRWPSGQVDLLTDIAADQKIRVFEGRSQYWTVQPTVWESDPPEVLMAGADIDFKATIRPALFEASAEIDRVVADLSDLGGPDAVPLTSSGDGTYELDIPFAVGTSGYRNVSIFIDQTTSLGSHWTQLSKSLAVFPAADLLILDDEVAGQWQVENTGGAEAPKLTTAGPVYTGELAGAFQVEAESFLGWNVVFQPAAPVQPLGYASLHFAFHPNAASGRSLRVSINEESMSLLGRNRVQGIEVDLEKQEWQTLEIPLDVFEFEGLIERIGFFGDLEGTFYLDDLRLVSAGSPPSTVVLEERTASLPESFALSQNYPNPFNSGTAIRFALPTGGPIDLSLYNLAGQKVTTLIKGRRQAGTYTAHWDGRDDRGRPLASGLYLYRLQTSTRTETRKLLLLR